MILAVVDYVEGLGPPPPDLESLLEFRAWGKLQNSGGIRDQRAGEIDRMLACGYIYDLWKIVKESPDKWKFLSGENWKTYIAVKKQREQLALGEVLVNSRV